MFPLEQLLTIHKNSSTTKQGKIFEDLCKWFLENDPKYKKLLKDVWLWKDWPGRWGPDAGIDLVAQANDGKMWAIQAKSYAPTTRISKHDVDTFLSESAREVFSYRLLIATTDLIGKTANQTLNDQEKPVGKVLLSDLDRAQLNWPDSLDEFNTKPIERNKPRPHQQKAIDGVFENFKKNSRGQLIMACGTGKTLTALWLHEKLQSSCTLVLLPSLSLLDQTITEWAANSKYAIDTPPRHAKKSG